MGKFLNQWNDPGLEFDPDWDPIEYETEQQVRLIKLFAVATHAVALKRRLSDASPEELAEDKRLSRKIKQRAASMAVIWGTTPLEETALADEEAHMEGAQVVWATWWATYKARLQGELRLVATTSIRTGKEKVGNKYANRLLNELNVLGQLFGE